MKKKIISILFAIFFLFTLENTCQAASASISCNSNGTVGEEITITANVTGVMWNLELKVNGETIAKNNELENVESNKTISFSGKYTPSVEGTLNVTLTGTVTEFSDGSTVRQFDSKTITVNPVPVVTPPPTTDTPSNPGTPETPPTTTTPDNTPVTPTKSTEARLKSFWITPSEYDFSGFSKNPDKEEWSTKDVPNSVTSITVYATPKDSEAKVSGDGKVSLKEGKNVIEITVTAEAGNTKTYKLNVTRLVADTSSEEPEENKSSEARLKKLWITPEEYDFTGFDKDTKTYTFEIPSEVEKVTIHAEPVNSKATVKGTGEITLKDGLNEIEVEVTAEDGKTEKYLLEITRDSSATINGNTFGLSQLQIAGVTLSPKFDSKKYEYTVGLKEDVDSLEIKTKSNDSNATIEIIGNENLQQGENTITILVTNSESGEVVTYQILVNKNVVVQTAVAKVEWLKPSTWGMREKILVAAVVVLLIIIIVAIIIKVRLSRSPIDDMEFPGAEELDRALAEHEELTGEEYYIPYQGNNMDFEQEYNDYYEDDIQYNKTKRRGKHF